MARDFKYCLKNEQECVIRFKNFVVNPRVFTPDNQRLRLVLKGFKISDKDQLILALIFRFGVIWVKKLDVIKDLAVSLSDIKTLISHKFYLFFFFMNN